MNSHLSFFYSRGFAGIRGQLHRDTMLEINNVTKSFYTKRRGWTKVLKGIDVQIPKDKSLGILGRNGAGKSTLINIISGMDVPDSGKVKTNGLRLSWPLGGTSGIHGSLTARENLKFICRIYGEDIKEKLAFVEEFAELGQYIDMPVKTYSSGMKSRLGFAISMALQFDTYLVDEGFSAGDYRFIKKTEELFKMRKSQANMIVVSHNPTIIKKYCDFAAVLHYGSLTLYDNVNDALRVYYQL